MSAYDLILLTSFSLLVRASTAPLAELEICSFLLSRCVLAFLSAVCLLVVEVGVLFSLLLILIFVSSVVRSSIRSFIRTFIRPSSFVCSFVRSFVHSFVPTTSHRVLRSVL